MRRSVFSRNTTHASTAVNTASKFSSSEAVAAGVRVKPSISANGPSTPPKPIASSNQAHSFFAIVGVRQPRSRAMRTKPRPMPLPRYNRPAKRTGDKSRSSALAKGVLAPNSAAAARAAAMEEENAMRRMPAD